MNASVHDPSVPEALRAALAVADLAACRGGCLRDPNSAFHRASCAIPLAVGCIGIPLQILSGDLSARHVARLQPAKLGAMEAHYETMKGAPLVIGGIPNDDARKVNYAIKVPGRLSLLVGHSPATEVIGFDRFPRNQWPNVRLVHAAFDLMVGAGTILWAVAGVVGWSWWRARCLPTHRWLLRTLMGCAPLGFIAIESGWGVTELGRQPWFIYGFMRTQAAVTPMPGLVVPFSVFTTVYLLLAVIVVFLLRRQFLQSAEPRQIQKTQTA